MNLQILLIRFLFLHSYLRLRHSRYQSSLLLHLLNLPINHLLHPQYQYLNRLFCLILLLTRRRHLKSYYQGHPDYLHAYHLNRQNFLRLHHQCPRSLIQLYHPYHPFARKGLQLSLLKYPQHLLMNLQYFHRLLLNFHELLHQHPNKLHQRLPTNLQYHLHHRLLTSK